MDEPVEGRPAPYGPIAPSAFEPSANGGRDRRAGSCDARRPSGMGSSQDCAVPGARGPEPAGDIDSAPDPAPVGPYRGPARRRSGKPALRDAGAGSGALSI